MCDFSDHETRREYKLLAAFDVRDDVVSDMSTAELSALIPDKELRQLLLDNIDRPAADLDEFDNGELMDFVEPKELKKLLKDCVIENNYDEE